MSPGECVWESRLPAQLGLNRDELRQLRKTLLVEGTDYRREKNGRVLVKAPGLEKLRRHIAAPAAAPPVENPPSSQLDEKNAAPGSAAERPEAPQEKLHTLLVWRANLPNRRIIEAYREGTDPQLRKNIVRVKVKDHTRFSRFDNVGQPMKVPARHLQADFYEHVGAMPRRKGRY
jgi:hypothetical protein